MITVLPDAVRKICQFHVSISGEGKLTLIWENLCVAEIFFLRHVLIILLIEKDCYRLQPAVNGRVF
jgi:hypothetical protein